MSKKVKLKPCPFCGGKAMETRSEFGDVGEPAWLVYCDVTCLNCHATISKKLKTNARDAWNRRKP